MGSRDRFASMVVALMAVAAASWGCQRSSGLTCTDPSECPDGQTCSGGTCVVAPSEDAGLPPDAAAIDAATPIDAAACPAVCGGQCDFATRLCTITGSGSAVECPEGWDCRILCMTPGACPSVRCVDYRDCDITCAAEGACGPIRCFSPPERAIARSCRVECIGTNACAGFNCGAETCEMTCKEGDGSQVCGDIFCYGGSCSRTCTGSNACGELSCLSRRCAETCDGNAACGEMHCGVGSCLATCLGSDPACGPVSCFDCPCDVSCDNATNACPTSMTCPVAEGSVTCADATGRCDSSVDPLCKICRN